MNELDRWVEAACGELGLTPADVEVGAVLDVARDVAHQVLRPGAPVTAYLMGVAVGRGLQPAEAAERMSALALAWPPQHEAPEAAREDGPGVDRKEGPRVDREDGLRVGAVGTVEDPPAP